MKKSLLFLISLFPAFLWGESKTISGFRGLHDSDAAILIGDNEAQDLLNVDLTDSGLGVKKRPGDALFKTFGVSTAGVTGGYYFRDASGNDNLISANNRSVYYSRSGSAYAAFITTDTPGAYYDFTDSNGSLWRADSSHDQIAKWNGTTITYYPNHPKGDQIEVLPDRLVISGVTTDPNTVYFSGAADFTDFTTGSEETSPFTENFGLPGQNVTAIKTMCGGLGVWTKNTLSLWTGTTQFDGQIIQVSPNIGTLQPSTVIQDGGVTYWQAQDNRWYGFDCNSISDISRNLDVSHFVGGESKLWNQTTKEDWDNGTSDNVTTTISFGDIMLSTSTTSSINPTNYSMESGLSTSITNWIINPFGSYLQTSDQHYDGSYSAVTTGNGYTISIMDISSSTVLTSDYFSPSTDTWTHRTLNTESIIYSTVSIKISNISGYTLQSSTFVCSGDTIGWYDLFHRVGSTDQIYLDYFNGSTWHTRSTTGTWTSPSHNIGTNATAFRNLSVEETLNGGTIGYFIRSTTTEDALSSTTWIAMTKDAQITATIAPWIQIKSTFTINASSENPTLSSLTIGWDEGIQAHHWGGIDKDHRLFWCVASGTASVPNVTYIYDGRFSAWLKYSIPFIAPVNVGEQVYFGNPSSGSIYYWPSGNTDAGNSFSAYWKSKDFPSGDPFVEKDFTRYSFIGKSYPGSNIDFTYDIDDQGGETVNFSLTDPLSNKSRRFNDYFPSGTTGSLINFSFGNDDADAPFEVHAFGYEYTPRPWRVMQ